VSHEPPVIVVEDGKIVDEGAVPSPPPKWLSNLLMGTLLVLLCFGPLAFGAVESWSQFVLESLAAFLFIVWLWGTEPRFAELWSLPLLRVAILVGLLGAFQFVTGLTAYRHGTLLQLQLFLVYGTVLLVARECTFARKRLRMFAASLVVFGFLMAMEAILQDLSGTPKLLGLRTVTSTGWIFGSYVNHSHFAGLMELLLPLAALPMLSPSFDRKLRAFAGFSAVMMLVALAMSRSLGGLFSVVVQAGTFLWIAGRRHRARNPNQTLGFLVVAAFLVLFLALTVWLDGGRIVERVLTLRDPTHQASAMSRVNMATGTLRMAEHRPILGWGLGTFEFVFPKYQGFYSIYVADHAHNDFLEWLAETGVIGFGLALWFIVRLLQAGSSHARHWQLSRTYTLRTACFLGCVGLLAHGLVDFNLHIPANSALFFALCGAASIPQKVLQSKELSRK
jgi:O-antigen ligase